ncbi:hypothetical protein PUNSTDRAFT_143545 [Punctularia strigosozonata HHB-11173 SS5]|uniref:uncharacterized protein n=1 Tax=Punctularia strigosozonata (strain HHB-11173) TaxID=741275 RepID=UPI0004417766|nr:uncharacterized protein PUNSTDRAFT_143545 [Punctularia strigosozonata HHB-11173 SS5]EIN08843.1 hypothetical protein PUNSTDRAFT_143545 [Punctularia strigosozonata HHB-11173 SS5]
MPLTQVNPNQFHIPQSAPNSPLTTKTARQPKGPPVTPQRISRSAHQRENILRSPLTPASTASTPYHYALDGGNRSFATESSNASILVTPIHSQSFAGVRTGLSVSPEIPLAVHRKNKSIADAAENWRTRASENGIRVASAESQFGDDEDDEYGRTEGNTHRRRSSEDQLLPAPFMSTQRRCRSHSISQTQAPSTPESYRPKSTNARQAMITRTPDRRSLSTISTLNTPPPNATIISRLKQKGISTDPVPRKRNLTQVPAAHLFDIDEDDFGSSVSYHPERYFELESVDMGFDDSMTSNDADPFHVPLAPMIEPQFQDRHLDPRLHTFYDVGTLDLQHGNEELPAPPLDEPSCAVCGLETRKLAILDPCGHEVCSACLTSALNIVGEKDMRCAVCNEAVENFHLQVGNTSGDTSGTPSSATSTPPSRSRATSGTRSRVPSANHSILLPSAFDKSATSERKVSNGGSIYDHASPARGAMTSTPVMGRQLRGGECVVLRIDNVPWDITPPQIRAWLKNPEVERVHVLLDRKGKTLSHAYVELSSEESAKAALRTAQNSVLGKGKRARGVTVTRTSQSELMKALFPGWQGHFDGCRPSLQGLANEHIVAALENGLISDGELTSLMHLIRSPDSHFLKVPSLPFHSLISILAKFPADVDSAVFWTAALRDKLHELAITAIHILNERAQDNPMSDYPELLSELIMTALRCKAFTPQQLQEVVNVGGPTTQKLLESSDLSTKPVPADPAIIAAYSAPRHPSASYVVSSSPAHQPRQRIPSAPVPYAVPTPERRYRQLSQSPEIAYARALPRVVPERRYPQISPERHYVHISPERHFVPNAPQNVHYPPLPVQGMAIDQLAREYGVDSGLVQALAERLEMLSGH